MSAPVFAGMAGFADNFAKSYGAETRRKADEEDRKANRAWMQELQARQRAEWQRQDEAHKEQAQLKTALKDAGAVRTVEQGTVVDAQTGAGPMQRTFTQNPEEASRVKAMMDAEAEMTGAAPAMAQPGTAVTGKMSQGHQISTGPAAGPMANAADPNSSEEVAKRTAQAYRQDGQMDKAIQMENAIMDQKAKRLGIDIDQMKFIDMQTNRALESALKSGPTWYEGAAKFVTELQSAGLKDVKAEYQLSPDGKSVTLFAVMPDGKKQATGTYPADESGKSQFMDKFASLPIEKRMEIMRDKIKSDKEDARWERTFDFNKTKDENDQQYKSRVLGFQASQDTRAADLHKIAMEDAKVPAAVKLQAASHQETIKSASAAIFKAMADGSFDPEKQSSKDLLKEQKMAMQSLIDTLAPYSGKAAGGAAGARPLGMPQDTPEAGAAQQATTSNQQAQTPQTKANPPVVEKLAYVPPANSPAGKAAANRAAIELQSMQKMQAAKDAALVAIQSGDPVAADAVRGMPEFMSLPVEQKAQIQKIIFGR